MDFLGFSNYQQGFLQDQHRIAGVTRSATEFLVYIVDIDQARLVHQEAFSQLGQALNAVNTIGKSMRYVPYSQSGCGSGNCGKGDCDPTSCAIECAGSCGPDEHS